MSTDFEVPFDADGNMLHDTSWARNITRRTVAPFQASLVYDGYAKGRSAMTFYWCDQDEHRYPMFLSDFDQLMRNKVFLCGVVTGTWHVVKRSGYFGIQPVPEDAK